MSTIDLDVQGMTCGGCVRHVTQALQALPGFASVDVDLAAGRVRLSAEMAEGSDAAIDVLTSAGYPAKVTYTPAAITPTKASGCGSGRSAQGGCCCA